MASVETGQPSAFETRQMTAAETSVKSRQKTSVLSQYCPQLLLADPDHEMQDFDQYLMEKRKFVLSISFFFNSANSF